MKRRRPCYKAMYFDLLACLAKVDDNDVVVIRDDITATHQIDSRFGIRYVYDVHFDGTTEALEELTFDGEDTERITVVKVSREQYADSEDVREFTPTSPPATAP